MKKILFFLLVHGVASTSPFCGFYLGGGIGGDYSKVYHNERESSSCCSPADWLRAVHGELFVGAMRRCGWSNFGGRVGYQACVMPYDNIFYPLGGGLDKIQGSFFDLTIGVHPLRSILCHAVVGIGWTEYRFMKFPFFSFGEYRNEKDWVPVPRLGAGIQWNFLICLVIGVEWIHTFPGRPTFEGGAIRERVEGDQFALTLSWHFL